MNPIEVTPKSPKKALVLSGGSIKGCYQAGVISGLLARGYRPDIIFGISVGSLNAVLTSAFLGKALGNVCPMDYWIKNIRKPSDIVKERSYASILWSIITKKFNGILDNTPLKNKLKEIDFTKLGVPIRVGAVDFRSGEIVYAPSDVYPSCLMRDMVLASTSIPIIFPPVKALNPTFTEINTYFDGGLRDVCPLKAAIDWGADEIVIIDTHTREMPPSNASPYNPIQLAERFTDIMVKEILDNDIERMRKTNLIISDAKSYGLQIGGKRVIDYQLFRPEEPIDIDITKFTYRDIHRYATEGYIQALYYYKPK